MDNKDYNCSVVIKQVEGGKINTHTYKFDDYRVATALCNILGNLDHRFFNYHEERIENNESTSQAHNL